MRRNSGAALGLLACAFLALDCENLSEDDESDPEGTGGKPGLAISSTAAAGASGAQDGPKAETCKSFEGLDVNTCLSDSTVATPQPVNMLLVLDKSGSMDDQTTYVGQSKWQAVTDALAAALEGTLEDENLSTNISFGLELFPREDLSPTCQAEDCCAMSETPVNVDVAPAATSVPLVVDALRAASPSGLTPTADALEAALDYYTTGSGSELKGQNYVLLATDGGPNCNDEIACEKDQCTQNLDNACGSTTENCCATGVMNLWCVDHARTIAQIEKLAQARVMTIVVGIPGSGAYREWLNVFGQAGEAPPKSTDSSFYEVTSGGGVRGLQKTFAEITQNLVHSCRIQLSEDPAVYDTWLVDVAINCNIVPQSVEIEADSADQNQGGGAGTASTTVTKENWRIDDTTSPITVELLGEYCKNVEKGADRVDIIVNCQINR